jgi:inositol transport system substrate-binding protein
MENWLSTGDQIDAVAANNDEMAIGALAAIEAAGKLGEIIVGGVDASADALAEMDAGRLNVTVFQNAVGQGEGGIAAGDRPGARRGDRADHLDSLRAR